MRLLLPVVFVSFLASAWVLVSSPEGRAPERLIANRPIHLTDDGYAGSGACQACHPAEYATWHASFHRTMTQVATRESVQAAWDNVTVADVHGGPMRLRRLGERFLAEFDDPDWGGEGNTPPRIERDVVMITGSHHQQIYWYATGHDRLLGQLPGAYLIAERRWIPRRMAVLHPPTDPVFSETGHWNSTCIACHATHGKALFDSPFGSAPPQTQTVETTVAEFGIGCEACHGPAEAHIRANRNPLRRYGLHLAGAGDATVTQPALLSSSRSSQVCGQCHGIWEFYDAAGERRANSRGLPFRPGDELRETRFVAQPSRNIDSPAMQALLAVDAGFVRDSFWADGMVRVSGREYNGLIESPCFVRATEASRTLSCFSCHTMHQGLGDSRPTSEWADDQLAPGMREDGACTQCHQPIELDMAAHTKHDVASAGSRCVNCHMPYTTYGLLKTIRSHTVSSPSVGESVEVGRPNACNLCHLDKTLAWTGEALARWYGAPAREVALTHSQQTVAASVLWALTGDAGQRAIAAAAFGWPEAQAASGTEWMGPFLAELMNDPYDAVRFLAGRSRTTLPAFAGLSNDFVAPPSERYQGQLETMRQWDRTGRGARREAALLMTSDGSLDVNAFLRLLTARDHRRVLLRE